MKSPLVAVVTVVLGALIAGTALLGLSDPQFALAGVVLLAVLGLAAGWTVLLGMEHTRMSAAIVIAVSGVASVGLGLARSGSAHPMAPFAVLLAAMVLVAFLHQLLRRDGRRSLVESLTATVTGQVLVLLAAGWVLLAGTRLGAAGVIVAAVGTVLTVAGLLLPVSPRAQPWAAFGVGLVASLAAVGVQAARGLQDGLLTPYVMIAIAVPAVSAGVTHLLASLPAVRSRAGSVAAGAGPICAVGMLAYTLARMSGA